MTRMVTKHAAQTCAEANNDGFSTSTATTGSRAMTKGRIALGGGRVAQQPLWRLCWWPRARTRSPMRRSGRSTRPSSARTPSGINERILTRVLLRAGELVREQQHGKPDLRPVVLLIHDNALLAAPGSYPILLVPANDSKVPPDAGGVPPATDRDLPSNLVAPPILTPLLSRMWKQSRTFRRQCARIGAELGLLVRVYTAPRSASPATERRLTSTASAVLRGSRPRCISQAGRS